MFTMAIPGGERGRGGGAMGSEGTSMDTILTTFRNWSGEKRSLCSGLRQRSTGKFCLGVEER